VTSDPVLAGMLHSFIAQREATLRASLTPAEKEAQKAQRSKLERAFDGPAWRGFPTREELLLSFARLQRDFDAYLAQFEELRAQHVLDRMRELRHRFPVHIPAADLQRCEEQYDRLLKRAGQYRRQIQELATQGAAAARDGDEMTAAWVGRRLQAINTLLPNLLPPQELEKLQATISQSTTAREALEVQRDLLERQREVAFKIKNLAGIIHRFHELAGKLPPEHEAYRRAELNYRRAVEEIRGMDTEWLSGLVLQLETLLDDLEDPTGQIQNQLDRFIGSVRTALNRLCLEIRARHAKRPPAAQPPEPPPASEGVPPPETA
jgi:DNA repair exonuclease SbcCD ATPase subunit